MHKSLFKFICHFLIPYKWWVFLFVTCAMFAGLWDIFNAILMKWIIDAVAANSDPLALRTQLLWPGILFLLNLQFYDLAWRGVAFVSAKTQLLFKADIIVYAFSYVTKQSQQFFQNNVSGKIASNVYILSSSIERALYEIMPLFFRCFVLLTGAFVAMYYVSPRFCFGLMAWVFLFGAISLYFAKGISKYASQYAESETEVSGVLVDTLSNVQNVRLFDRYEYEQSYLTGAMRPMQGKFASKAWYTIKLNMFQGLAMTLLLAFMLFSLVQLKATQALTAGDFALILGLSLDIGWNLWWLTEQLNTLVNEFGRARQTLNKLFEPVTIQDMPGAKPFRPSAGRIEFKHVNFNYPGANGLFFNKSVIIEPGQKVGLVGHSGSGKTTFASLILRLFDVNDGSIQIDGQDIKYVTQESLRKSIALIPQDPILFNRTVRENILYGKLDATETELITATKRAHAYDFIQRLPQKFDTRVGERGLRLSGGQRQRIVIARAIIENTPIIILDEATSQLDSVTEQQIQDSLWDLMENKTSLVIAHRLTTLQHMDRILVFSQGKIVQDGTHAELIEQEGLYKELWETQAEGFLAE